MYVRRRLEAEAGSGRGAVALAALCGLASAAGPLPVVSAAQPPDELALGRTTFVEQCSVCHKVGAVGAFGPDLKGILGKETFSDGEPMNEEALVRLILDGRGRMPRIPLEPAQIAALVAYLRSL